MLSFGLLDETVPAESMAASLSDWRVGFEASLKASAIHIIIVYLILMCDAKKHLGRSERVVVNNNRRVNIGRITAPRVLIVMNFRLICFIIRFSQ
jgi:hypothetical protein